MQIFSDKGRGKLKLHLNLSNLPRNYAKYFEKKIFLKQFLDYSRMNQPKFEEDKIYQFRAAEN